MVKVVSRIDYFHQLLRFDWSAWPRLSHASTTNTMVYVVWAINEQKIVILSDQKRWSVFVWVSLKSMVVDSYIYAKMNGRVINGRCVVAVLLISVFRVKAISYSMRTCCQKRRDKIHKTSWRQRIIFWPAESSRNGCYSVWWISFIKE